MDQNELTDLTQKALEISKAAWDQAHQGLPSNPMTKAAAIPAAGILAASILSEVEKRDAAELTQRVHEAIEIARKAWALTHRQPPGNPIAATAERSVIGIIAAGILNHVQNVPAGVT